MEEVSFVAVYNRCVRWALQTPEPTEDRLVAGAERRVCGDRRYTGDRCAAAHSRARFCRGAHGAGAHVHRAYYRRTSARQRSALAVTAAKCGSIHTVFVRIRKRDPAASRPALSPLTTLGAGVDRPALPVSATVYSSRPGPAQCAQPPRGEAEARASSLRAPGSPGSPGAFYPFPLHEDFSRWIRGNF
jgi:hypothetical protein